MSIDLDSLTHGQRGEMLQRLLREPRRGRPIKAPKPVATPTSPTVASTRVHPEQSAAVKEGASVRMLTGTFKKGVVMKVKGAPGRERYHVLFAWEDHEWAGRLQFEVIG